MKKHLIVSFSFFCAFGFSQKNLSLDSVMNEQKIDYIESSVSNSKDFFAALLPDSKTLFVAKNEIGDIPLSNEIEPKNGEGAFRPNEFPSDHYIYYTFFDVSSIIQSKVSIHPKSSIPQKRRKPYANLKLSGYMNGDKLNGYLHGDPLINKSRNTYQTQLALANANSYYVDRNPNNVSQIEYRYSNQPSFIFVQNEEVICFSQGAEKVSIINLSGDLISSNEISTTKPLISSSKGRNVIQDNSKGNFYLVVETNFSYNIYQLDVQTGKTKYLFKTEGVWENPNWKISDGTLTYSKIENGVTKEFTRKL